MLLHRMDSRVRELGKLGDLARSARAVVLAMRHLAEDFDRAVLLRPIRDRLRAIRLQHPRELLLLDMIRTRSVPRCPPHHHTLALLVATVGLPLLLVAHGLPSFHDISEPYAATATKDISPPSCFIQMILLKKILTEQLQRLPELLLPRFRYDSKIIEICQSDSILALHLCRPTIRYN